MMLADLQTETVGRRSRICATSRGASTHRSWPTVGLVAALEAQARKWARSTSVEAENVERYAQQVEAAAHFCALEALNNVAKYAGVAQGEGGSRRQNGDRRSR